MLDSLLTRHKPDILDCIANLSSDEVFTTPAVANKMLDLLPPEVWTNPELRFLDPGCKSGVFLREAAKRLLKGLELAIPDEVARREHIFRNMLHGIAITELTAQISRRTLYYSKDASSKQSVVSMPTADGNIRYQNIAHTVKNGSCVHCGAPEDFARDLKSLESHAYLFIHEALDTTMKFDVIIGNPPYQLSTSKDLPNASPIYQKFIERATQMNPEHISMIVPSRWFAGGKGLDEFRTAMREDKRLATLVDCPDASECFPGVEVKGGVCYFHWNNRYAGPCDFQTFRGGKIVSSAHRHLDEFDFVIRNNAAVSILHKVLAEPQPSLEEWMSSQTPYGMHTNFSEFADKPFDGAVRLYARGVVGWVDPRHLTKNKAWTHKHQVLLSTAYGGGETEVHQIIGKPFTVPVNSCCTQTYLVAGRFDSADEANNFVSYLKTKMVRFLIGQLKNTQHVSPEKVSFVPQPDLSVSWTDKILYAKYGLNAAEIDLIEATIKELP